MRSVAEFVAGRVGGTKPHLWVDTGQLTHEGKPSLACMHCPHGRDNPVHTLPENVVDFASRRKRR